MLKVVRSHNKSIYSPCKVESTYIFFQKKKLGTLKKFSKEILPTEKVDWTSESGIGSISRRNGESMRRQWECCHLWQLWVMSLVNLVIVVISTNSEWIWGSLIFETQRFRWAGTRCVWMRDPPPVVHTLRWRPSQRMAHGLTLGARSNARYWFVVNCRELPVLCIFYSSYWVSSVPSRELTYPTWGKGKSSSKVPWETDMLVPGPAS